MPSIFVSCIFTSCIFMSCNFVSLIFMSWHFHPLRFRWSVIFMPCYLAGHFHVLHVHDAWFWWSVIFTSCIISVDPFWRGSKVCQTVRRTDRRTDGQTFTTIYVALPRNSGHVQHLFRGNVKLECTPTHRRLSLLVLLQYAANATTISSSCCFCVAAPFAVVATIVTTFSYKIQHAGTLTTAEYKNVVYTW